MSRFVYIASSKVVGSFAETPLDPPPPHPLCGLAFFLLHFLGNFWDILSSFDTPVFTVHSVNFTCLTFLYKLFSSLLLVLLVSSSYQSQRHRVPWLHSAFQKKHQAGWTSTASTIQCNVIYCIIYCILFVVVENSKICLVYRSYFWEVYQATSWPHCTMWKEPGRRRL